MNSLLSFPSTSDERRPRPAAGERSSAVAAFTCGLLGLLPAAGLVLGPVAIKLGLDILRPARQDPGASRGRRLARAAVVLGALGLLVQAAAAAGLLWWYGDGLRGMAGLGGGDGASAPAPDQGKQPAKPAEIKKVEIGRNVFVEVQDNKPQRVLINATVCARECQLEQLLTRKGTKEHEAVLAADVDARHIHAALILAGAKEGSPVKFAPKYEPAKGSVVKVTLQYEDKGKLVTVPAQQWVRNFRNRKNLEIDWVFAGSRFFVDPLDPMKKEYLANAGDVICVSNFDTAMLDLPIKSPQANADLTFEAHTERIPPLNTNVTVILEVAPEKK